MRAVIVTTHPIQYQAPLFRELARWMDLTVFFLMRQTAQGQAAAGFGVEFEWDTPILNGYSHVFAKNVSRSPCTSRRRGIVLQGHELLLASLQPDVVMTMGWFPYGNLQVIQWAASARLPLVCRGEANLISGRSLPKRLAKFFYFPWLLRKFQAFATIGKSNHDFYRHYGVPEFRLHHAPYSVDTRFFQAEFQKYRPSARRPGPWRIGFAGKLIPKKRPLDLVEAMARCKNKEEMELIMIGDGPLYAKVEKTAHVAGVKTVMRGFLNQSEIVSKGYSDLDALVLPSGEYETWGLVVNEAMTGGIPAIVSDLVGCASDLVDEGRTGCVFPNGNIRALSSAIKHIVEALKIGHDFNPAVRRQIDMFSLERTVSGIVSAMNAVVSASC